jgi:hypothetical protein
MGMYTACYVYFCDPCVVFFLGVPTHLIYTPSPSTFVIYMGTAIRAKFTTMYTYVAGFNMKILVIIDLDPVGLSSPHIS